MYIQHQRKIRGMPKNRPGCRRIAEDGSQALPYNKFANFMSATQSIIISNGHKKIREGSPRVACEGL